ncbi:hypothetical protein [Psychroserpens sp. Hel_I_66]|uniref:hypothetical protein n=1 Tax=Psychroserpens sp. Hel_I_66 TaxID=1250004 RepID=UPI000648E00A|nr:hypothetical protein [Psychroserpens sp. Hel_I_66]
MDKLKLKSTKEKSKLLHTDKKSNSRSIINGSLIGVLISITPIFFYSYIYVPETKIWENLIFTYDSGYYEDVRTSFWMIMTKLIPLFLLFIWFFTCRHWWYHAILVPISMYIYQLIGTINEDVIFFDNFDLMYMLPIMAIVIPSIYLIRAKMFNKINDANKTLQELEEEFKMKPKGVWGTIKQYF